MPELPEVETMRRGLLETCGAKIKEAIIPPCSLRPVRSEPPLPDICSAIQGRTIRDVQRLGKRVLLKVDDDFLIFQPKMTGLVHLGEPPDWEHVRLVIEFRGKAKGRIVYWDRRGLGTFALWAASEVAERLNENVLGPDALAIEFDDFMKRFVATKRAAKVALLDQKLVAGVGNLYASEILHRVKLHPASKCHEISKASWKAIYVAMRDILERAIENEGSTLGDGTYRNKLNEAASYQNHHQVYDREGERCFRCKKADIVRIVQAQRATFYCPNCQR